MEVKKTPSELTSDSFEKLLARLHPDREQAGQEYQSVHLKLVKFFQWRGSPSPADDADRVMNRVARKIAEGEEVGDIHKYIHGVARMILKEVHKEKEREHVALRDAPASDASRSGEDSEQFGCFDRCLDDLPPDQRQLITTYYQGEGRSKITNRERLARQLDVGMNVLRIRAHRIRMRLEECVRRCVDRMR